MPSPEHAPPVNRLKEWVVGLLAGAIAVTATVLGSDFGRFRPHADYAIYVEIGAALTLILFGSKAVRGLAAGISRVLTARDNPSAGDALRLITNGVGLVVLLFTAFAVLGASLGHLLIGAGLTGVVIGIAAQQSLGNIFASVVLLFARPFVVGDTIQIRSGTLGGVFTVTVLGSGLTYVTVRSDDGVLRIPNSLMLGAGITHLREGPDGAKPTNPS